VHVAHEYQPIVDPLFIPPVAPQGSLMASLVTATGVAILLAVVTTLAARGRLPRNAWAGIRTRRTTASDEAWVRGHRAAVPAVVATAGIVVPAAVVVALAAEGDARDTAGVILVGVVVVGAVIASVRAHRGAGVG
jgi:uncharacterized membrane protein